MSEAKETTIEDRINAFDPNDPEALASLEKDLLGEGAALVTETSEEGKEKPEETKEDGKDEGKKEEKQDDKPPAEKQEAQGEPSDAQVKKVVKARDGVHEIPYSVLERERERANRAEATISALNQQLEQLKTGGKVDKDADGAQVTDQDLKELDDISPEVAKIIRGQMAQIEALSGELVKLRQEQEVTQKTREQEVLDEVAAAIEGNPDLVAWREAAFRKENPDPTLWKKAGQVDDMLKADPDWADKPFTERFAKAVDIVKTMHGIAPAAKDTKETKETETDLKKAADAKLNGAAAPVPQSLSEIPGGAPPAQSDMENLENVSAVALGNKFLNMPPDQIESYLARLG